MELPAPRIRKGYRASRAGEVPAPGPGGCSASRRASCPLPGFGDLPGALIELPTAGIREVLQRIYEAGLPALGFRRSSGCSDRAADVKDTGGPAAHPGGRAARSWAPEIFPGGLTVLPVPRIRRAPWCSDRAADAEDPGRI